MGDKQQKIFDNRVVTANTWQCDGIWLGHAISTYDALSSFTASNKNDVVRLHFGLKGDYKFTYRQLNRSFDLIGGHHNLMYSKEFDMVVENKTLVLETFGIQFPVDLFLKYTAEAGDRLKRFADNVIKGNSVILTQKWGTIDTHIQQVITQIIHCKYTGDFQKLFLLAKTVELLVLSADGCIAAEAKNDPFIKTRRDKEKIIAVRDFINERVHCPPNLSEIAKTVGLNEYKLKRGFKETFHTTVFGYLTDQRLNLARQYLFDTQQTAAEIAYALGYATPQHFNNAFKKKFGITPYSVKNNPENAIA
jgi:AraC-like DNA-binding protein